MALTSKQQDWLSLAEQWGQSFAEVAEAAKRLHKSANALGIYGIATENYQATLETPAKGEVGGRGARVEQFEFPTLAHLDQNAVQGMVRFVEKVATDYDFDTDEFNKLIAFLGLLR